MIAHFFLDHVALERDPNLFELQFEPGIHRSVFETRLGQQAFELITSRVGVALLVGAICSAPSRPPIVAIEHLLAHRLGDEAFSDPMKQLIGRIVRYVIEHIGGEYQTRGVKISEELPSRFKKGSTYTFPALKGRPV